MGCSFGGHRDSEQPGRHVLAPDAQPPVTRGFVEGDSREKLGDLACANVHGNSSWTIGRNRRGGPCTATRIGIDFRCGHRWIELIRLMRASWSSIAEECSSWQTAAHRRDGVAVTIAREGARRGPSAALCRAPAVRSSGHRRARRTRAAASIPRTRLSAHGQSGRRRRPRARRRKRVEQTPGRSCCATRSVAPGPRPEFNLCREPAFALGE